MNYSYRAFRADGTVQSGSVSAASTAEAEQQVRDLGLFPDTLEREGGGSAAGVRSAQRGLVRQGRLKWLGGFTRQLSVLSAGGTQLVDALVAIERQTADPTWSAVVRDVRERVEHGESLAEAMLAHPRVFDGVYRSMISAGESGGDMREILQRLSNITRAQQVTRAAITGAMVYPALLLTVCFGVLVGLVLKVLPRFEALFETLNAPLPPSTAMLMSTASLIEENAIWLGLSLLVIVGGAAFGARTQAGRRFTDRCAVGLPVIGTAVRSFKCARFARITGVLLHANVPLLDTLTIARESAGNSFYEDTIDDVRSAVERGESMSDVLRASDLFDQTLTETVRNGEQSGRIGDVLVTLADMMDEDNAQVLRTLTGILEPVILSLLGVVVGGVAISLFLPLFDLTASTGAGP
ncbi:MAG: type II secretion system F family protein [Planctomycetota bacterium]